VLFCTRKLTVKGFSFLQIKKYIIVFNLLKRKKSPNYSDLSSEERSDIEANLEHLERRFGISMFGLAY